jgi:hypothetical protein
MEQPLCSACHKVLLWGVVWPTHRGGPICELCMDEEMLEALNKCTVACAGGCGRTVLDLRNRGQKNIVCSDRCRHWARNADRRMERRAMLPVPSLDCVECGEQLVLARSDVRYCSGRCRVRAHRRRAGTPAAAN